MVQASELRIGNWINEADGTGQITAIQHIPNDDSWVTSTSNNLSLPILCFSPIELSHEILEKCGLVKDLESARYNYNDHTSKNLFVRIEKDGFLVRVRQLSCIRFETLFLHQLQNLYFALTNEELKIDLPNPLI